jgi:hypothetical protein
MPGHHQRTPDTGGTGKAPLRSGVLDPGPTVKCCRSVPGSLIFAVVCRIRLVPTEGTMSIPAEDEPRMAG